ncbi:hypothetical protein [Roseobacter sp.]|uniref:hypothetical protein n=1 Tax=Roseobacter sp. TaxID=1907202 RepID=UPI0025D1321A|nr:hypothetical protein [Roseobacter sp.]
MAPFYADRQNESAVLTTLITLRDMEKMTACAEKAVPAIISHCDAPLFRATVARVLRGTADYTFTAAFHSPDVTLVEALYRSDA